MIIFGIIGGLNQLYISILYHKNTGLNFACYLIFAVCLIFYPHLWIRKRKEIIYNLGLSLKAKKPLEYFPENFDKGHFINEAISMKWMSRKIILKAPKVNFLLKYIAIVILFGLVYVMLLGSLEALFSSLQDAIEGVRNLDAALYYFLKGLFAGLIAWGFKGIVRNVTSNFVSEVELAFRTTKEDFYVGLNFCLTYLVVIGYPLFIFIGKRVIFNNHNTDFEIKYFLGGYSMIFFMLRILFSISCTKTNMKKEKKTLFDYMLQKAVSQQPKKKTLKLERARRAVMMINTSTVTSLDHVELEFERDFPSVLNNPESQALTSPPTFLLDHLIDTFVFLALALTFFVAVPSLLLLFLVTSSLSLYFLYKKFLQTSYPFLTFRTDIPLMRKLFSFIFIMSVVVNFWYFYEFYPSFIAKDEYNLGTPFGSKVENFINVLSNWFEDKKFFVVISGEHLILIVWGWSGSFRSKKYDDDKPIRKIGVDLVELGEKKNELEGFIGSVEK
jgi:hypothetical protein